MPFTTKRRTFKFEPLSEEATIKIQVTEGDSGAIIIHIDDPADLVNYVWHNRDEYRI